MKKLFLLTLVGMVSITIGCASVMVTKTGKGYFEPTNPNEVEILVTVPMHAYTELATVVTQNWKVKHTAKMHNSLRSKCAPLGADAVVLGDSGIAPNGKFWASGVAIQYND
ncbi:MAG: hypothetical protein KAS92_09305 [Candidatus Omnitrophica bacterium]|nr:hypothetical protein [Candidatus Omnitrophota bacterium]